jgi:phage I-like protein
MTLSASQLIICATDPADAGPPEGGAWIKLLPSGTFSTRDGRGPFHAGDADEMAAIIQRTKDYLGGTELMIDYDHQSVFGAVKGVGGTAKAAGWVKDFEVRGDGIYGRVAWTAAARDAIDAGEYRYISPTFAPDKTTRHVSLLFSAALLNTPAMDLAAVAAHAELSLTKGSDMDELLEALGLAGDATVADAVSAIKALTATQSAIALAVSLDEDASTEAITAAVTKAMAGTPPDPAKYVPIAQVEALQADVKKLQSDHADGKAETLVTAAIEAGKLAPALKDWGLDLARKDPEKFEAFTASAPELTSTQLGSQPKQTGDPDLSDADLEIMSQMGLDRDAMVAAKKDLQS